LFEGFWRFGERWAGKKLGVKGWGEKLDTDGVATNGFDVLLCVFSRR
jgi:hypothetical protein